MKNLNTKLLTHLEEQNNINPTACQINVAKEIDKVISNLSRLRIFEFSRTQKSGIYIFGSVGVGKTVLLKALNILYPSSKILHFNDLIFYLQTKNKKNSNFIINLKKKKLILIDEFFINNLTSLILFRKFIKSFTKLKIPIIMSGNKKISIIYNDPINPKLCKDTIEELENFFKPIKIKSKIDYRAINEIDDNFFFIKKTNSHRKQNLIIKQLSLKSIPENVVFNRAGNSFKLSKIYGNLIDVNFESFFLKNLIFQDYELIASKIKIFVIRNIKQMDEDSKNLLSRFISFIDVLYENKNILSISSNVGLECLYTGKTNSNEFKRTLSRLKEMGSSDYIKHNSKELLKKKNEVFKKKI